jgi:hypothetical protein
MYVVIGFLFCGVNMYLQIRILDDEKEALRRLSEVERRPMRQQAALLVRRELERRGLLPDTKQQPVTAVSGQGGDNADRE